VAENLPDHLGQEIQGLEHLEVAGGPGQQFVIPGSGKRPTALSEYEVELSVFDGAAYGTDTTRIVVVP
jgi:hypothetical protein